MCRSCVNEPNTVFTCLMNPPQQWQLKLDLFSTYKNTLHVSFEN